MSAVSATAAPIPDDLALPEVPEAEKASWFTFDRIFVTAACTISIGFFVAAYSVSAIDPDYFSRRLLSTMRPSNLDPIMTGTVGAKPAGGGEGMPVPRIVRARAPMPGDYQIVMVFEGEAILATADELVRVKVGTVVPGLGEVLSIEPTETGGVVGTSEATLRSVAD